MDKLFIVDGNSLIFRAFYALPPMYNSARTPTNAVFGFVKMLINIIVKNQPEYMAVAFDAGKHTFRHNLFAEYFLLFSRSANRIQAVFQIAFRTISLQ